MRKLTKVIKSLEDLVNIIEKNEVYKNVIGEIPDTVVGLFPPTMQMKFKAVYADMRINGHTKEKSLDTSSRLVMRGVNKSSVNHLFVEMQKTLMSIHNRISKGEHFSESVDAEEHLDSKNIPIIEKEDIPVPGSFDVEANPNEGEE
jgi:hypothetical protein